MLYSVKTSGVEAIDFTCLTRAQKEKIEVCFEENQACQEDLASAVKSADDSFSWDTIIYSVLGGFAGGMMAAQQLRH